ncbi:uncharacterized protein LOC107721234 isoform X2 [Sinocyclocheilus rhinocerous]|uniref:uncharacterized protein LOC107721234 isoform X2 n=1 Tax=Sinocyclocheilus rhinocerous TaxID=307959 RepID=UPI0007BAD0EC|nr:PREDICTED: uncharacterized protein LOC107721234 isoform X2 [Sinocyclocheilus rhinocerous]
MKEETEKLRPNIELLKEKMALIKCYRRNFVSNHSTEETLSEFPCFRLAKMLLWDLRDHTSVDVDQQILTQLSVMAPRVLQVSRSPLKDKFRRMIEDCEDGRLKKGQQLEAAILLLPALFKEDPGLLYEVEGHAQTSPPDIPTPKMVLKGCREGHPMQYDHIVLTLDGQDAAGLPVTVKRVYNSICE